MAEKAAYRGFTPDPPSASRATLPRWRGQVWVGVGSLEVGVGRCSCAQCSMEWGQEWNIWFDFGVVFAECGLTCDNWYFYLVGLTQSWADIRAQTP